MIVQSAIKASAILQQHQHWIVLARDLTEIAREGTLDPVIGRSKEITRVIEVLGTPYKKQSSA